ncbi:MAG TPA: hypothetical protein VGL82_11750 [Bryobacteraceae bacterium]
MSAGPPGILERIVALLLPPACREEVLGDLREKYTGILQYIGLAMNVVPSVIWSRIRRTADAPSVLTEGMLVYASYLAAAWYVNSTLPMRQGELFRLAVPAVLFVALVIIEGAWTPTGQKSPARFLIEVTAGSLFIFLCTIRMLPETLNLIGACASLLLVSAVRLLFRSGSNIPQSASAAFWLKPNAEPLVVSGNAKRVIGTAVALYFVAVILMASHTKAGVVGGIVSVFVVIASRIMSRKE